MLTFECDAWLNIRRESDFGWFWWTINKNSFQLKEHRMIILLFNIPANLTFGGVKGCILYSSLQEHRNGFLPNSFDGLRSVFI